MLTYDRRAPEALLEALRPGGFAHSLVEYGRSGQYALDLQLRGYGPASKRSPGHWATLYCGLTKVVDLHYLPSRGFRLDVHPTWKAQGWEPLWSDYSKRGPTERVWKAVEGYLERVIPVVGSRFLKEGSVQSAVSAFQARDMTVIDREVAISFANQKEKNRVTDELQQELLGDLGSSGPAWWARRPKRLGGECDALAVDDSGALLAIEIKPAKAVASIPWAPVQVRHYSNLISLWAMQTHNAREIIDGMVAQRVDLGLARHRPPSCARPEAVRPVVAIQRGASPTVLQRLREVHARLVETGHDEPPTRLYEVNLVGRLDPLPDSE